MRKWITALLLLAFLSVPAIAQQHPNQEKGFDPNKVYSFGNIDHVNMFNSNLVVTIPIGSTYPVNRMSYGFDLVYNGNPWRAKYYYKTSDGVLHPSYKPNARANAGFGWLISLGRLIPPSDPTNETNGHTLADKAFVYESADGRDIIFEPDTSFTSSHPFLRTRRALDDLLPDSSNLRMSRNGGDTERYVDFPDGRRQTFTNFSGDWRLTRTEDTFGNYYTISYAASSWTLTDRVGRSQVVHFAPATGTSYDQMLVTSIDLASFGNNVQVQATKKATYTFTYLNKSIDRPADDQSVINLVQCPGDFGDYECPDTANFAHGPPVTVAMLNTIILPNGETYSINAAADGYSSTGLDSGMLRILNLPTGGRIEWTWAVVPFHDGVIGISLTKPLPALQRNIGVFERKLYDRGATSTGAVWKYEHAYMLPKRCSIQFDDGLSKDVTQPQARVRQKTTIMTAPDGARTVSYFSVYNETDGICDNTEGWSELEYGMPLTHYVSDPLTIGGTRYLSTEVFDTTGTIGGTSYGTGSTPASPRPITTGFLSSRYISYAPVTYVEPLNSALVEQSVSQYAEDSASAKACGPSGVERCYTVIFNTSPDSYGRMRQTSQTGNYPGTTPITTLVNYTRPNLTDLTWLHGLYTEKCSVYDADLRTDAAANCAGLRATSHAADRSSTWEQFSFTSAGFLSRHRILAGSQPQANDLLELFVAEGATSNDNVTTTGNVGAAKYFGGDKQDVAGSDPAQPVYSLTNTYANGTLARTEYQAGLNGATPNVATLDTDIDANTGLVRVSRDTAGVRTLFDYDTLGRLKTVTPANGSDQAIAAVTNYTYEIASGGVSAAVAVSVMPANGSGTALSHSRYEFDSLGRLVRDQQGVPGSTSGTFNYGLQTIEYDSSGRKHRVSAREDSTLAENLRHWTEITYDFLGRETSVKAPDDSVSTTVYHGGAAVDRVALVAMAPNAAEQYATTTETYDAFGRLVSVTQKPTPTAANVVATYGYDVASHLTRVALTGPEGTQNRSFTYDGRGFLLSESHPETGFTGYLDYDARGHVGQTNHDNAKSIFDQRYSYDAAERLKLVESRNPYYDPTSTNPAFAEFRPLKIFTYATANVAASGATPADLALGKLRTATRYNYPVTAPSNLSSSQGETTWSNAGTMLVTDTYAYTDPLGRKNEKTTDIYTQDGVIPPVLIRSIKQSRTFNDLGLPLQIAYPKCLHDSSNVFLFPCGTPPAGADAPAIPMTYEEGRLTSLDGYVSKIEYGPNGMVNKIKHSNGINDTITMDPNGMTRPRSFEFGASTTCTPPVFTTSPSSRTEAANTIIQLSAVASGQPAPSFTWYKVGSNAPIATGASIMLNVGTTTAQYFVEAGNSCAQHIKSDVMTITVDVCNPPLITSVASSGTYVPNETVRLAVSATGSDPVSYAWYKGAPGTTTVAAGSGSSINITASATAAYWVRVSNNCGQVDSGAYTVTVALPRPATASTTATTSSSVTISWGVSAGAHHYQVERMSAYSPFTKIADVTAPTTFKMDTSVQSGMAYIYRVRAVDSNNASASPYSPSTLGMSFPFTSVQPGSPITSAVFQELLTALNALRLLRLAYPTTWDKVTQVPNIAPVTSSPVRAQFILGLRIQFDAELSHMGLAVPPYGGGTVMPGTAIQANHITSLQTRATRGQ